MEVGSSMLYFEKAASSYEEAIQTCLKRASRLLEIHDQEEWSNVRAPFLSCLTCSCVILYAQSSQSTQLIIAFQDMMCARWSLKYRITDH